MSYVRTLFHIVFRTKESVPALSPEHAKELFLYIWGFCKEKNCTLIRINGMPEHLHLLLRLHPDVALSAFVRDLKIATNLWLKREREKFPLFSGWARSYAAFSYSSREQATVAAYIEKQQEHHRKHSFSEEFRAFLEENGIPIDERYFLSE